MKVEYRKGPAERVKMPENQLAPGFYRGRVRGYKDTTVLVTTLMSGYQHYLLFLEQQALYLHPATDESVDVVPVTPTLVVPE